MDEQRLFATGTNPATPPEHTKRLDAMQAEIDAGLRKFGEPRPEAAPGGWREAIEAAAVFVESTLTTWDMPAAFLLAKSVADDIRALTPPRPEDKGRADRLTSPLAPRLIETARAMDKGRADIAAEVPEGDGGGRLEADITQMVPNGESYRDFLTAPIDDRFYVDFREQAAEWKRNHDAIVANNRPLIASLRAQLEAAETDLAASCAEVERERRILDLVVGERNAWRDECQSWKADISAVLSETARELGCEPDNEAILAAIAASRARADALVAALERVVHTIGKSRNRASAALLAHDEAKAALAAHRAGSKGGE